jgi:REP element-mobilizing transposase RayT
MIVSAFGDRVRRRWLELPKRFSSIDLDTFIVMPDHVHGIIHVGAAGTPGESADIGDIVRSFKISTQNDYRHGLGQGAWEPFDRLLWQRGFHDRIVRSERELVAIRASIEANPARFSDHEGDDS